MFYYLILIFSSSSNLSILLPCNRILGNIISGSKEQTNEVVKYGGIDRFFSLLSHEKKTMRKEACWCLSNITSENPENIGIIFNSPLYIKKLLTLIAIDIDEIKKEGAWVVCNCTKFGSCSDIYKLVEWGGLETFETLLDSKDSRIISIALEGIANILICGRNYFSQSGENPFLVKLEKTKAIWKLENLQLHESVEIYQKVVWILENFCDIEQSI